jgi:hypothetical protein
MTEEEPMHDAKPAWWLMDGEGKVVAAVRADTAIEARDRFKAEGQTGVRVKRADIAPVEMHVGGTSCAFCGNDGIDPEQDYQRIRAWRAKRHGTNSPNYVRLIEPQEGEWACRWCIDKLANGVSPHQQTFA